MEDDFNTALALSSIFDLATVLNRMMDEAGSRTCPSSLKGGTSSSASRRCSASSRRTWTRPPAGRPSASSPPPVSMNRRSIRRSMQGRRHGQDAITRRG